MNFLHLQEKFFKKISCYFHTAIFYIIKKPLYILNFNTDGNHFQCKGCLIKSSINVHGNGNQIIIEQGVRLKNVSIVITGNNNKLIITQNSRINEKGRIRIEDTNNQLKIGKNVDIQSIFFSLADKNTSITIGDNCLFSSDIVFRTSDSHSIIDCESKKRINQGDSITIGNHVWLSNGVNILKGVTIGDNSIIGTKSIVTKNIPSNSIAVGIPAKVTRQNVTWCQKRI